MELIYLIYYHYDLEMKSYGFTYTMIQNLYFPVVTDAHDNLYDAKVQIDQDGKITDISLSGNEYLNSIVQEYMKDTEFKVEELENLLNNDCRYFELEKHGNNRVVKGPLQLVLENESDTETDSESDINSSWSGVCSSESFDVEDLKQITDIEELDTLEPSYKTHKVHSHVLLLRDAKQDQRIQIFAGNPEAYINLLHNYKIDYANNEVSLQNEFWCKVSRCINGNLTIKFKMFPNGKWYAVGEGLERQFDDCDIYQDFTDKVDFLLRHGYLNDVRPNEIGREDEIKSRKKMENEGKTNNNSENTTTAVENKPINSQVQQTPIVNNNTDGMHIYYHCNILSRFTVAISHYYNLEIPICFNPTCITSEYLGEHLKLVLESGKLSHLIGCRHENVIKHLTDNGIIYNIIRQRMHLFKNDYEHQNLDIRLSDSYNRLCTIVTDIIHSYIDNNKYIYLK